MRASASTAARICALVGNFQVLGGVPICHDTIDGSEIQTTTGWLYIKSPGSLEFFLLDAEIMLSGASFQWFFKNDDGLQSLEHQKTTHFHGCQCLLERCSFLDSSLWQVDGKLRSESGIHQPPRCVIWMKQTSPQDALEVDYSAPTAMLMLQSVTTSKLFHIENSNTLRTSWNRIHLAVSEKNPWSDPLPPNQNQKKSWHHSPQRKVTWMGEVWNTTQGPCHRYFSFHRCVQFLKVEACLPCLF